MTTITIGFNSRQNKHYITGAVTPQCDYDANDGIPAEIWHAGRKLIRRALADGVALTERGDRYQHGEYAVVVERIV